LGKRKNKTRLPTHLSQEKKNRRWNHLEGHGGTKSRSLVSSGGARRDQVEPGSHTKTTHTQLQGLGEEKGNCPHVPPGTSMDDNTAHALLSGDGEKMEIGHPTNDPRPLFGKTRKHNSITNPPFTRKEKLSLVPSRGARGDQVTFIDIICRGTGGPSQTREPHHNNPYTTPRTWRVEGELSTYASRDEHGRHYLSCATEWGWREDENRPRYKRPEAIVQANAKTQLDYGPTFHRERKTVAGII